MAENNNKANKAFAQTEREQIRELFKARANSPPIPDPFNAQSMQKWEEYVIEMRELEAQLKAAGGVAMSYPKYAWVGNRIAESDMAVLFGLKTKTHLPITELVAEAVRQYIRDVRP
ncbi:MAG: hypothetical protein KJ714_05640 [Euryarchaeota archaeon]|nr:hypothetical protein [Euryarchaeota archaeon]